MASFSRTIAQGTSVSGSFRARVNAGDEISISVDCAGTLSCEDCGIALSADANETDASGAIIGTASDSGVATKTGTFVFNYTGYNATGPGNITASGFQSLIEPLSVSPLKINFSKSENSQVVSVSGSVKSFEVGTSASWISFSRVDMLSASVSENDSIRRSGYITITATMEDDSVETATVNIEQAGEPFKVIPSLWNVGNGGGARTLSVTPRNVDILANSSAGWATYSNKAIRATRNDGNARTATFTIYASAPESPVRESATVAVNQEAAGSSSGTGGSNTGAGGESGNGSSGTETAAPGTATPSGSTESGGRVGTVIFRNAAGGTLHYIIRQNP